MKKFSIGIISALIIGTAYSCTGVKADNEVAGAAFEYRDIYLPVSSSKENHELELNNLDEDWGIWGHNLANVLPDDHSLTVYAQIDGNTEEEQFCFTSNHLYKYICNFIEDNYGRHDSVRFAIVPNDNTIACLCEDCVAVGNTKGNATPAVFEMVSKLATKYPNHTFFTSHYLTTSQLPSKKLPNNSGVLISAMQYPLSTASTPAEDKFKGVLSSWQGKADKIYIWDYISNFDDYFTPFPVFNIMQRRFRTYRDLGVHGLFLNGSGEDYTTFGRLKKAVLAQLMINPDLDWQSLLRDLSRQYYPVAGDDIADFIIAQENMVQRNGKKLPLYDGVHVAKKTYLTEKEFIDFYNKIQIHKKNASGWEKQDLETMAEALSYTLLELRRENGKIDDDGHLVRRLNRLAPKGIEVYNEGCWSIADYLRNYAFLEENFKATQGKNLLKGVKLAPLTPLDEEYNDISMVTDGILGIPSNYHSGNLISSADPALEIEVPRVEGLNKLKVWMVYNPAFKIGLPEEVSLMVDGAKTASKTPARPTGNSGHTFVEFDVPASGRIVLSLAKNPDVKTMAIDEIEGFN